MTQFFFSFSSLLLEEHPRCCGPGVRQDVPATSTDGLVPHISINGVHVMIITLYERTSMK